MISFLMALAAAIAQAPAVASPPRPSVRDLAQCILEKDPAKGEELFYEFLIRDEPQGVHFDFGHPCFQGPFARFKNSQDALQNAAETVAYMRLDAIGDCLANNLTPKAKSELASINRNYIERSPPVTKSPEKFRALVGTGATVCSPTLFEAVVDKPWLNSRLLQRMISRMPHA